jgi:hypothetical protein
MNVRSTPSACKAGFRRHTIAIALASALGISGAAHSFEIETGNEDISMRWDNTIRYNAGLRAQKQNPQILGNANYDDGDRNFGNGSLVTSRFDVLSEFDFIYKRSYGFRASYAAWWDPAYNSLDDHSTVTANTLNNGLPVAGVLSPYTKRYSKGVSGEWLDAFGFANFDVSGIPVSVKAGQHTVFWGDSLLLGGAVHSVSYSQNALDLQKGFMTPGSEAKELFRPEGGITLQVQPTNELSLAGQWFYNWQAVRIPESGSYLTINDAYNFGGDSAIVGANPFAAAVPGSPALLRAWNTQTVPPSRYSGSLGDWGLAARWSPAWLDGTLGFYGRNTTDMLPQTLLTVGFSALPGPTCTAIGGIIVAPGACIINPQATSVADLTQKGKFGTYTNVYGTNIHIYGITLAKSIGGVSVGAELSYRQNMPLLATNSSLISVLPPPLAAQTPGSVATTAVPANGTPGPLGDTYHGLINAVAVVPKTWAWDTASLQTELTWMRWARVTQNEAAFKGNATYNGIDKVSRTFFGLAVNFTPTWFQVFPGVDLTAPVTWSQGISGNAAVLLGGNEGAGNWSAGIAADLYQKYNVKLAYNGYFGNYTIGANGAMNVPNGTFASLSDRGWVSLTFKTTF